MANKAHEPTEATRATVRALSGYVGLTQEAIGKYLGIDSKTLRKYYSEELEGATIDANRMVGEALFQQAINGNIAAQIFWMKCRARWTERVTPEETDEPQPIRVIVQVADASVPRADA